MLGNCTMQYKPGEKPLGGGANTGANEQKVPTQIVHSNQSTLFGGSENQNLLPVASLLHEQGNQAVLKQKSCCNITLFLSKNHFILCSINLNTE